jgi:FKBP-type peptidyl-prolyl cis-trans isomerase (trigger factor)
MSLDVYLRTIPEGLAGLKKRLEAPVRQRVVRNLFLAEFIKKEKLEVTDEEVEKEFQEYVGKQLETSRGSSKRSAKTDVALRRNIGDSLLSRRIIERLSAIGQGNASTPAA